MLRQYDYWEQNFNKNVNKNCVMTCKLGIAIDTSYCIVKHKYCFCTMHSDMSDFETTNLHCFVAPGSIQIALDGTATLLDL